MAPRREDSIYTEELPKVSGDIRGILSERDGRAGGETGKPDQAGRGHAGNASHGSHFRVGR